MLEEVSANICGSYTLAELARLLDMPRAQIQVWRRHGLIQPADSPDGPVFDFRQVATVKALSELKQAGVSTSRLRKSLEQLSAWLPDVEDALLRFSAAEGALLVRDDEGGLAEPSGQRRFDFTPPDGDVSDEYVVSLETPPTPERLFEQAAELEHAGRLDEAAEAYRRWLRDFGADAQICFNLGNVLAALNKHEAATERFRQAVELSPAYVEAWNNLGAALAQTGQREQALAAFAAALEREPAYSDALYNLADTLDELGRAEEACRYWRAYLAHEKDGPWAQYARQRVSAAPRFAR